MGRCETGDKRRGSCRRGSGSPLSPRLLFSLFRGFPPFYARPCGQLALTPGFARKFMSGWSAAASSLAPPASSYHRFTTSPLTCVNFRMRVSARQLSNPATPFFAVSCTIDAIGKIVDFALNAVIYCRGNRTLSPSPLPLLKAKAQRGTTAVFKGTEYLRD